MPYNISNKSSILSILRPHLKGKVESNADIKILREALTPHRKKYWHWARILGIVLAVFLLLFSFIRYQGADLLGFQSPVPTPIPVKQTQTPENNSIRELYNVRIIDEKTNTSIKEAIVSVEIDNIPKTYRTGEDGIISFTSKQSSPEFRIRVEAKDYKVFDEYVSFTLKTIRDVRLSHIEEANPTKNKSIERKSITNKSKPLNTKSSTPKTRKKTIHCSPEDILLGKC